MSKLKMRIKTAAFPQSHLASFQVDEGVHLTTVIETRKAGQTWLTHKQQEDARFALRQAI